MKSSENSSPSSDHMEQWPWYHGAISRERSEELLSGQSDGVYLIRASSQFKGDLTLSLAHQGKFKHYRMQWVTTPDNPNPRLTLDNNRYFNCVTQLIDRYSSRSQKALSTRLVRGLPKISDCGDNYVTVHFPPEQPIENRERLPTPPPELATDSLNFNDFILEELMALNKRVEDLAKEQDRLEIWGRQKIILFHGVSERSSNDILAAVIKIITNNLRLHFNRADISRCHRLGRTNNNRPKTILVKFKDVETRDSVWYNKGCLEGTGITISEFLTRNQFKVFAEARKRFGVANCWTKDGIVVVITADGSEHRVTTLSELSNIQSPEETTSEKNVPSRFDTSDKTKETR